MVTLTTAGLVAGAVGALAFLLGLLAGGSTQPNAIERISMLQERQREAAHRRNMQARELDRAIRAGDPWPTPGSLAEERRIQRERVRWGREESVRRRARGAR